MSSPMPDSRPQHDRRFPPGTNRARCGASSDLDGVLCRRPPDHEPPHRCRAIEWTDDTSTYRSAAGLDLIENVPHRGRDLDPIAERPKTPTSVPPGPTPRQGPTASQLAARRAIRSRPSLMFRSAEWDGPAPAAGDIVTTTEAAYVVTEAAVGAGPGHYTITAQRARIILWTGAPPSPA